MSDIVERLRKSTDCDPQCQGRCEECPQDRQREAADEIERLRARSADTPTPTQDTCQHEWYGGECEKCGAGISNWKGPGR